MSRVLLFHWNAAEAAQRIERLRRAGHPAVHYAEPGGLGLRALRDDPPRAVVIDLGRLPSQGRGVAIFLRQQKGTREVPIVFVGGAPEKVAQTRALLPDAVFAEWRGIRAALRRALARALRAPVVPGTFDAYAGTPLPRKLGVRAGASIALIGAPRGFARSLGALPEGARLTPGARGPADLVLLFVRSQAALRARFIAAARALAPRGALWLVWPKKEAGVKSDLTYPVVHAFGVDRGFVEYKISAIDDTWSGLRFARAKRAPGSSTAGAGAERVRGRARKTAGRRSPGRSR